MATSEPPVYLEAGKQYRVEDTLVALTTLRLRPGDILAVLSDAPLSKYAREYIAEQMSKVIPEGVKVLVLDSGLSVARVTVEEPNGPTG